MLHHEVDLEAARQFLHKRLQTYPENDRGLLYLEMFILACLRLKDMGEIEGVEVYPKHSSQDLQGVDAAISVRGQIIAFQITSTLTQVEEHRHVHKKHPERPPVHFLPIREGDRPTLKNERRISREIRTRIKRGRYR